MEFKVVVLIYLFIKIISVQSDCRLSLSDDFGNPVYLKNGQYLRPDKKGDIIMRKNENLTVACPGKSHQVIIGNKTTNLEFVIAKCVANSTFKVGAWSGLFKNISCNTQPWFTTEPISTCYKNKTLYRVGYNISSRFFKLYEACFDKNLVHTAYVTHTLSPENVVSQNGFSRPSFIEGNLFNDNKMSKLYKMEHQKSKINSILGQDMDKQYLSKKQFLTRGHLAPRADFTMRATQRASFHYVNTAPQWMRGNAGDWAALEEALRRRVSKLNTTVTVYTGTTGVSLLADKNGQMKEIYLDVDKNNNNVVPVPMYFFKLVYDPKKKTATAFVTLNSSAYDNKMIDILTFCDDVCEDNEQFRWLKWRSTDGTHSFCCSYEDFIEKVDYLPQLDVKDLFY